MGRPLSRLIGNRYSIIESNIVLRRDQFLIRCLIDTLERPRHRVIFLYPPSPLSPSFPSRFADSLFFNFDNGPLIFVKSTDVRQKFFPFPKSILAIEIYRHLSSISDIMEMGEGGLPLLVEIYILVREE